MAYLYQVTLNLIRKLRLIALSAEVGEQWRIYIEPFRAPPAH